MSYRLLDLDPDPPADRESLDEPSDPRWITSSEDLKALAAHDRLRQVLVRYRGRREGRFTVAAQDAGDMIAMLEDGGCYVRDIEVLT